MSRRRRHRSVMMTVGKLQDFVSSHEFVCVRYRETSHCNTTYLSLPNQAILYSYPFLSGQRECFLLHNSIPSIRESVNNSVFSQFCLPAAQILYVNQIVVLCLGEIEENPGNDGLILVSIVFPRNISSDTLIMGISS